MSSHSVIPNVLSRRLRSMVVWGHLLNECKARGDLCNTIAVQCLPKGGLPLLSKELVGTLQSLPALPRSQHLSNQHLPSMKRNPPAKPQQLVHLLLLLNCRISTNHRSVSFTLHMCVVILATDNPRRHRNSGPR